MSSYFICVTATNNITISGNIITSFGDETLFTESVKALVWLPVVKQQKRSATVMFFSRW